MVPVAAAVWAILCQLLFATAPGKPNPRKQLLVADYSRCWQLIAVEVTGPIPQAPPQS